MVEPCKPTSARILPSSVGRFAAFDLSQGGRVNIKRLLIESGTVFVAAFVVCVLVTLLWNLVVHRALTVDWETSFRLAILFGIILPWIETRRGKVN